MANIPAEPQGHGTPRPSASAAIVSISLELLAVGLFTLLAGVSSDVGRIVLLVMVTLWVLYAVTNASVIAAFTNAFNSLSTNPTNK